MGIFDKLKQGLEKTRRSFSEKMEQLISGSAVIDEDFLDDLEGVLLSADVGVKTTVRLMADIRAAVEAKQLLETEQIKPFLAERIAMLLTTREANPDRKISVKPYVIMVVGVNGVGKTTTIAKLANYYHQQGSKVLLAAADTFRAGAIEQLEVWGQRIGVDVIKQTAGSDPAAVAFDAVQAAKSRRVDIVIIDTAGRLQTKTNLMEELKKITRVIGREMPGAPHETLLILDATTGQNAVSQARLFNDAVPISAVALTKLDGTAKGGVVIAVNQELSIPVTWVGVGEGMDDLRPFAAAHFAAALFDK